jgi:hypothetical protein
MVKLRSFLWMALLGMALMAGQAQAITFTGTAAGIFGTPTPSGGGVVYSGVGTNEFRTGTPADGNTTQNIFRIDGLPFNVPADSQFALANLTYSNGRTMPLTRVDSVPVDIVLSFTNPAIPDETFTYNFAFNFTLNSPGPVDDELTISDVDTSAIIQIGNAQFTLDLLGFSQDGGDTITDVFYLPEDQTTQATLYAALKQINDNPIVPEPSTMALSFIGLSAIGLVRRFRRS